MGMFKEAVNQQAFLKAGLLGFAGAGKTTTAAMIAKGISELSNKQPVFFADTETGSDFFVSRFKEWGIPFYVSKSRAFTDLMSSVQEAEKEGAILIIDSITHFWQEVMKSYMKANNRKRLLFQDWGPIKGAWGQFTDLYLNSRCHILMCGRASFEYDYFTDEAGAKQLEKTGTKMSAESNMGYEPSLLIEMVREKVENPDESPEARLWKHIAVVLKDRTDRLQGQRFVNPGFEQFKPVFDFLNIGGEHIGVVTGKNSEALFTPGSESNWAEKKKMVAVMMEEIQGVLTSAYPGSSADDKKVKTDLVYEAFGTRSWTALEDMSPDILKKGLEIIAQKIAVLKSAPPSEAIKNGHKKEKAGAAQEG